MAKKKLSSCKPKLKGSNLKVDDVQAIMDEAMKLDESQREGFLRSQVLETSKQNRQILIANAHDAAFIKRKIEDIMANSKSYTEALKKVRNDLVGRAGVDSSRIVYKNRLLNMLESFEASVGTVDGLRKLKGSSDLEKQVYIKVHGMTEKINVEKLLSKDAKAYRQQMLEKISGGAEVTDADRMAFTIAAYNEYTRMFMREHGIPTQFHKNYVVKRRYDPKIIEERGDNGWAQFMADRVNAKESFGTEMTRPQLVEKLTAIAGKIRENDELNASEFNFAAVQKNEDGSTQLKHKFKRRRELVFKDAAAEYEVFDKLSSESLAAQVQNSAWALSSEAMKTKHLGYNSSSNYDRILLGVRKEASRLGEGTRQPEIAKWRQRLLEARIAQSVADLSGTNKYSPTGISTFGTTLKLKNSIGLLGNSVATAMLDPLDAGRQMFYVNGEMFGGMVQWAKNFTAVAKENGIINSLRGDFSKMQALNAHLGAVTQYIATDSSMRMARGEIAAGGFNIPQWVPGVGGKRVGDTLSKNMERWSSNAMKYATFLPQQTAISKTSSGLLGAQTFTGMVDIVKNEGFGGLNKFQKDTLKEYGITEQDMKLFGMVERYKGWGDNEILSGKMIREALTSGDFKKNFESVRGIYNIDEEGVVGKVMDAADKYDTFLTDFFTRATPTPELAVKTSLFKATDNEMVNVLMGLMTQFYDTPMMQMISYKEMVDKMHRLHDHKDPNVREWIRGVGGPIAAQTTVQLGMGMAAYLAFDHALSAIAGKDSKLEKLQTREGAAFREIMYDVAGRTSAVPFAFELVNATSSRYQNGTVLDMLKSPSLSLALDTGKLINTHNKMTTGKYMKKHLTPNAFWWQAVSNRLGE